MFSLNHYFDRVFVIHMEKDKARETHIAKEFQKIHTNYEFSSGVIPTKEDRERYTSSLCNYSCSQSMLGIYLAHRNIWEFVVKHNIPRVVIFEDDVSFTQDIFPTFPKAFQELPANWDLLYLGCMSCGDTYPFFYNFVRPKPIGKLPLTYYSEHLRIPYITLGTEAYAISLEGAKKLLQYVPYATNHVDVMITNHLSKLNCYLVYPRVAYQYQEGIDSNNNTSAPVLLNTFFSNINITSDELTKTTVSYALSVPFAQVNNDMILNVWCVCFFLGGYFRYICILLTSYLLLEYLYIRYIQQKEIHGYQYLLYLYFLWIGFGIHYVLVSS
jgi:GR25 family glycosyltransferase involved in LPS biosynthesis